MQRLEVSGAVRPIYGSLGVKRLVLSTHYPPVTRKKPAALHLTADNQQPRHYTPHAVITQA